MKSLMQVFKECQSLGLTSDQRHFSAVLLGRSPNWLSSSSARDRRWSTESLLALYFSLTDAKQRAESTHADAVWRLRAEVWDEIASRVRPPSAFQAA